MEALNLLFHWIQNASACLECSICSVVDVHSWSSERYCTRTDPLLDIADETEKLWKPEGVIVPDDSELSLKHTCRRVSDKTRIKRLLREVKKHLPEYLKLTRLDESELSDSDLELKITLEVESLDNQNVRRAVRGITIKQQEEEIQEVLETSEEDLLARSVCRLSTEEQQVESGESEVINAAVMEDLREMMDESYRESRRRARDLDDVSVDSGNDLDLESDFEFSMSVSEDPRGAHESYLEMALSVKEEKAWKRLSVDYWEFDYSEEEDSDCGDPFDDPFEESEDGPSEKTVFMEDSDSVKELSVEVSVDGSKKKTVSMKDYVKNAPVKVSGEAPWKTTLPVEEWDSGEDEDGYFCEMKGGHVF